MNHLRNILNGFSNVFSGFQPRVYANDGGFGADADSLRNDAKVLGQDFTTSANKVYGKATTSASKKR